MRFRRGGLPLAVLLLTAASAHAEPPPAERSWTFGITPYIWLPAMTGNAFAQGIPVEIDTSISDIFTESDFVFAFQAEAEVWYRRRFGG